MGRLNHLSCYRSQAWFSEAHNNLGNLLQESGDLVAAISCYENAIQANPSCQDAYNNIGVALQERGELSDAIYFLRKALEINPSLPDTHKNLSHCLLLKVIFLLGGTNMNGAIIKNINYYMHNPMCQRWNPDNHDQQEIERLLLVSEQGIGDTLQFMRYLDELKKHVPSVSLCAP